MLNMGKKQFAKNSANVRHFRLVSRSAADPNADDPDATPLVLEPFVPHGMAKRTGLSEQELLTIPDSLQETLGPAVFGLGERVEPDERDVAHGAHELTEEDLEGDCYFPKDGYNYEQHLKNVSGTGKKGGVVGVILEAPAIPGVGKPAAEIKKQVAATNEESEVLRALDNDEEYEEFDDGDLDNMLPGGLADEDVMLWGPTALEARDMPDLSMFRNLAFGGAVGAGDEDSDDEVVELGGYQQGGATSSEARPGNAEFDEFLHDEYADDEIGGMDEQEIEGHLDLNDCEGILDEYLEGKQEEREELVSLLEPQRGLRDDDKRVIEETKAIIARHYSEIPEESEDESTDAESEEDESRFWDCETVLSTLSNVSNRPGKINKIKVLGDKPPKQLKAVNEEEEASEDEGEVVEIPEAITVRPKGETKDEKKARKASVKEMRRVCRQMKKESKDTYKKEAAKLTSTQGGADIKQKQRCLKL